MKQFLKENSNFNVFTRDVPSIIQHFFIMNRSLKSRKKQRYMKIIRSDPSENIPPKCEPYTGHFSLAMCSTYSAFPVLKKPLLLCFVYCHTTAAMYAAPQPHAAGCRSPWVWYEFLVSFDNRWPRVMIAITVHGSKNIHLLYVMQRTQYLHWVHTHTSY